MRYIFTAFLVLLFSLSINIVQAFEGQGFTMFSSEGSIVTFLCENTCIIPLGSVRSYDKISLQGTIQGTGQFGYGVVLPGGAIQPIEVSEIIGTIESNFTVKSDQLTVIFFSTNGRISTDTLSVTVEKPSYFTKIQQKVGGFFQNEELTPYSINFRYGPKWGDMSINELGYRLSLFIIVLGIILKVFGRKYTLEKWITYTAIGVFLIIGNRNLVDYITIAYQPTVFDTYYTFTKDARDLLALDTKDNCFFSAEAKQDWPYISWWRSVYMSPCIYTKELSEADFFLVFQTIPSIDLDDYEKVYESSGNLIYKINN